MKIPVVSGYTFHTKLKTIKPDWKGTPLDQDDLFINSDIPTIIRYCNIVKFMLQGNPQLEIKKRDTWRIPVLKDDAWLRSEQDMIVWLGHASFFIQLSGIRILIDPMFGKLPTVSVDWVGTGEKIK